MRRTSLYVLDCENEPSSKGKYRLYCIDDSNFRFYTLRESNFRKSPGDRLDHDSGLPYSLSIQNERSGRELPYVIRRMLMDLEMHIIQNYRCSNFSVFPVQHSEIESAFAMYFEDIHDFRDLSAVIQQDVVNLLASGFLSKLGVEDTLNGTDLFWNPDGLSEFEFAEKLNGACKLDSAAEFYSRSLARGNDSATGYLSSDFLDGRPDGILDEDLYRRCYIINKVTDGEDPLVSYHLANHFEHNLRVNPSFKGASATKVVELYKKAQSKGCIRASYRLGLIHQNGLGRMSPNISKAIRAYKKCGNDPDALFKLASCYESTFDFSSGKGIDGIDAKGICQLYRESADLGNRYAGNRLELDASGTDPMVFTEARLPAYAGDNYARYLLAQCYESGVAGTVSYDQAIQWYNAIIDSTESDVPVFSDLICRVISPPEIRIHDLMFRIGELYELSNLKDYHLALQWFIKSANAGNERAAQLVDVSDLGSLSDTECMRRLLLRSEEGDPSVIRELAVRYENGIGTKKDIHTAVRYRRTLAIGDDPDSQLWLAAYLESKARDRADMDEALQWYERASANGNVDATERIDLSSDDVPEGQWFSKYRLFMYHDDPMIQYRLGHCYESGDGVSTSYSLARKHYQRAIELGSDDAKNRLDRSRIMSSSGEERYRGLMMLSDEPDMDVYHAIGEMYLEGDGVERSESLAYDWFESASNLGHLESSIICADMISSGAVKRDISVALDHYRRSADSGNMESNRKIGRILSLPGSDVKGHPEAIRRLRLAAHDNDPEAQFLLGRMFEKGLGMPQFYAEAFRWYTLSSENGNFDAKYRLMLLSNSGRGTRKDDGLTKRLFQELKSMDSGRLLRTIDSCIRGNDRLTVEFKSDFL